MQLESSTLDVDLAPLVLYQPQMPLGSVPGQAVQDDSRDPEAVQFSLTLPPQLWREDEVDADEGGQVVQYHALPAEDDWEGPPPPYTEYAEGSTEAQWEVDGDEINTHAAPAPYTTSTPDVVAPTTDWESQLTELHQTQAWLVQEVEELHGSVDHIKHESEGAILELQRHFLHQADEVGEVRAQLESLVSTCTELVHQPEVTAEAITSLQLSMQQLEKTVADHHTTHVTSLQQLDKTIITLQQAESTRWQSTEGLRTQLQELHTTLHHLPPNPEVAALAERLAALEISVASQSSSPSTTTSTTTLPMDPAWPARVLRLEAKVAEVSEVTHKLTASQTQQERVMAEVHQTKSTMEERMQQLEQQNTSLKMAQKALCTELQRTLTAFGTQVSKGFEAAMKKVNRLDARIQDLEQMAWSAPGVDAPVQASAAVPHSPHSLIHSLAMCTSTPTTKNPCTNPSFQPHFHPMHPPCGFPQLLHNHPFQPSPLHPNPNACRKAQLCLGWPREY